MIGVRFIYRFIQLLLMLAIGGGMVVSLVWVLNKVIQMVGNIVGVEVGDFLGWVRSKLPEIKWRKKDKDATPEE